MAEPGRADLAAVGPVGAVRDQIDGKFTLGRFGRDINLALRHPVAFGVKLEVVDQRFHRGFHIGPFGRGNFRIEGGDRALGHVFNRLPHNAKRLAHFLEADQEAGIGVAVLAYGYVKIKLFITVIGLGFPQVPRHPGGAQHHPGKAPVIGGRAVGNADVDIALFENAVFDQQGSHVIQHFGETFGPGVNVLCQAVGQILVNPAGAEVSRVHARAGHPLIKYQQFFPFFKTPQDRRHGADVHGVRSGAHQVVHDAAELGIQDADIFGPFRHFTAQQLFHRQREGMLLVHRRAIIKPVKIGDRLQVSLVFNQLFGAPVEQPDMRVETLDHLAVQLHNQAQHAVSRGMLGPEIEIVVFDLNFGHYHPLPRRRLPAGYIWRPPMGS